MEALYTTPVNDMQEDKDVEGYLTTKQAAARLNLKSDSTIRHAIRDGELAASKPGHDWLVTIEELERWAREHKVKPRKPYTKRKGTTPNN
jgi:excisionase family DNA binding protein